MKIYYSIVNEIEVPDNSKNEEIDNIIKQKSGTDEFVWGLHEDFLWDE